ncbi:MAG: hypothetical protein ABEK02_02210 [Haloquadratum sp.]
MQAHLPSRRQVLGAAGVSTLVASAGCLGLLGDRDAKSGDGRGSRRLRLTLSRDGSTLRESFVTDLSATRRPEDDAAFEATLDGETHTTRGRKPFGSIPEDPVYTKRDGTYYRLGSVVVDEVETVHPVLRLYAAGDRDATSASGSGDAGGSTGSSGSGAVATAQLPEIDQKAVRVAYFAARARGNAGGVPWGLVRRGGFVYPDPDRASESELLADGGPSSVRYRDRRYRVETERERFYEPVYRATVDRVAASPGEMESILRAQFVDARFSREDRSAAAQDVLERARRDGYAEPHPFSAGFREVLRAMHKRAYLDGNVEKDAGVDRSGRQILLYDDVYYDYRLRFVDGRDYSL